MFIYKITNIVNNKMYIGQTIGKIEYRLKDHVREAYSKTKTHGCRHLNNAIKKYLPENFIIEQIDIANTLDELNKKEIYWIKLYNAKDREIGYNIKDGGDSHKWAEESKEKVRQSKLGKSLSFEHRKSISEAKIGKPRSIEAVNKQFETRKLKKMQDENYGISLNHPRKRKIVQLDIINNNLINIYNSFAEAQKKLKKNINIYSVCNGKRNTAGGFKWMYYEDYQQLLSTNDK